MRTQKQFTETTKTTTLALLISVFYFTKEQDNCVDNGPEPEQEAVKLIGIIFGGDQQV